MLKKEFELYGKIKKIRLIKDLNQKSKGYGFIEFENEKDFISAYRQASGKKILNKRIEVDAEYGRSRNTFRPLRLGGGLNKSRRSKNHCFPIEYNEFRKKKKIRKIKKEKIVEKKKEVVVEMAMEMEEGEIVNGHC